MSVRTLFALLLVVVAAVGVGAGRGQAADEHLTGKLLVADTSMADPRFAEAVIYMVRHDDDGAFGLIINKPIVRIKLAALMQQFDIDPLETAEDVELFFGGPVQGELGFVLHTRDFTAADGTLTVEGGYAVSGFRQVLRAIGEEHGPAKAIFATGYAGWGPDQLEGELARGDWNVIDADEALVFDLPVAEKWAVAHSRRSVEL